METATTTLLERERELHEVAHALQRASTGSGSIILTEAVAGLGKTALLREASRRAAHEGFLCLGARASELAREFAYGVVRQLLEPVVARTGSAERERLFQGAAALAEPLFAPAHLHRPASSVEAPYSALHGLYWLVNNLADEAPVAMVVDDLHWADAESLQFLNYLAPRLDGLALVVFASTRPSGAIVADVARLAAGPETTVLRLRPLGTDAVAALYEDRLGRPVAADFASACRTATGGNPFFLEALLHEVIEQHVEPDAREAVRVRGIGPAAVAHAVLLRLSGAPATAAAMVRAVAVLGDGARPDEAAQLAGIDDEGAAAAADLLTSLEILKPGEALDFAHPIIREAVYADIGARQRAQAHARAAEVLLDGGAASERIAAQLTAAEPRGDAARVELLRTVAADALARGAPAAAVAWLRRALREPPPEAARGAVLLELGAAEQRVASPEALEHLAEAVGTLRDPDLLATAVRLLAAGLTWTGASDRAISALAAAIEVIEPVEAELALILEADLLAHAQEASLEARAPAARRLERHGGLSGDTPGERLVLGSLAFERARASTSAVEAAAHIERALVRNRLLEEQELDVAPPLYVLVVGLLATEALDLADACMQRMLDDARARGSIPGVAFVLAHTCVAWLRRGSVSRAESDARTAMDLLTDHGIPLGKTLALAVLVEALVEGGDIDGAEEALTTSGLGELIPPGLPSNPLLEARAKLRLAQGRAEDGLTDLFEFGRRDELWGGANPLASRWRSTAALALAADGQKRAACDLAHEDLARAERWGAPSGIGVALRTTALVEGGPSAVDRLRRAMALLERSPARLELARALTDLGSALRRAGHRAEARGPLRDGLRLAERCGARRLADHGRTELRLAGGRANAATGTGLAQLTTAERRVAELAAEGYSNPEIAQTLFVTRKTVETHLGSVYRKLGISGRVRLQRALAHDGSTDRG
jgi:DNA-binding CsgD family transcriptional regulator